MHVSGACCAPTEAVFIRVSFSLSFSPQESPLPQELLDRLSRSEIRSISDLQRLLEIDSVENEVIDQTKQSYYKDVSHSFPDPKRAHTHTRHRRSTVVEEALPAMCKVRTMIYEIPRSQVDPTSANFIIWPPCVEVKRCTGCCNTSNMRCQAARKHHRTVKVQNKIMFLLSGMSEKWIYWSWRVLLHLSKAQYEAFSG
uniref:Platelet-derived growth factor subunit A n=1 Tax=Monopterus albus TaxID=43700 RepID=A0A3Q3KH03_MONAL